MSKQYGTASVYGVDGTVAIDSAEAMAAFPESVEAERRSQIDELMSPGKNTILGFRISDKREIVNFAIVPKSTVSVDDAIKALKFMEEPAKVTFTPTPGVGDTAAHDVYGAASVDYIYSGGVRRTQVRGRAGLTFTAWRPIDGEVTVAQLLTEIPQTPAP